MPTLSALGLMSGSSLDGVDLAWCQFTFDAVDPTHLIDWKLIEGATIPYPVMWENRLRNAPQLNGRELWQLHIDLGHFYGASCQEFLTNSGAKVDFVASHGHTVFHFPQTKMTTQIGDGAAMAATLELPVIDQFRSQDMALGGQGAPLAPLADKYLFLAYRGNLNLGGIANVSIRTPDGYIAFDVGGANQVLDALAQEAGLAYDDQGQLARSGTLQAELLAAANALPYFQQPPPKSLGNDWVQEVLLPIFQDTQYSLADRLHTFCLHCAEQIAKGIAQIQQSHNLPAQSEEQLLVAGGGAFNIFLCECVAEAIRSMQLVVADAEIAAYKEAILMALAGALRWLEQPNVLPSATGASRASVGGAIHWGGR